MAIGKPLPVRNSRKNIRSSQCASLHGKSSRNGADNIYPVGYGSKITTQRPEAFGFCCVLVLNPSMPNRTHFGVSPSHFDFTEFPNDFGSKLFEWTHKFCPFEYVNIHFWVVANNVLPLSHTQIYTIYMYRQPYCSSLSATCNLRCVASCEFLTSATSIYPSIHPSIHPSIYVLCIMGYLT